MQRKVESFIDALRKDNPGVEAVALYQNGQMLLEHHFVPNLPRLIYSHTKSFISTASGIAIEEGKISLDTEVCEIFPEYASFIKDERVNHIKLRHFLTMSSGFGGGFLMGASRRNGEGYPDYIGYLLSKELRYPSGEGFFYSNGDSHMAGCMVERAVGIPLLQYCYDRIFLKLGIGYPAWETDPHGTAFGGSGLYLSIADMMKLGILYLQKGRWNGEQILSEKWVKAAGSKQIDTGSRNLWNRDYGYQFWMIGQQKGAFRAAGIYGQLTIILPEQNAVLATQCSESNDISRFEKMLIEYTIQ